MYEDFAPKLAHVLTSYSQPVGPGDIALIRASTEAIPAVEALYEAILRRGAHPIVEIGVPTLKEILLTFGNDDQLRWTNPVALEAVSRADVIYAIHADANVNAMNTFDAQRLSLFQEGRKAWLETYHRRFGDGSLRFAITAWPTQAAAQRAGMGLLPYTEFIYRAAAFDQPDPIAHWVAFRERQDRLIAWLDGKRQVEVTGPGIDLSFSVEGRRWVNAHGDLNFPDGEIYTGPVEESVNGHVAFNFPAVYGQREVEGVELTFKDGVVVEASARKGEDYLLAQLDQDEGARRLGEFAIGTNDGIQQFTGMTLFDEKIGGTIHMALGHSIPMTLGQNKSSLHWDMVHNMKDGGEIRVDGELFYRNGTFVID